MSSFQSKDDNCTENTKKLVVKNASENAFQLLFTMKIFKSFLNYKFLFESKRFNLFSAVET